MDLKFHLDKKKNLNKKEYQNSNKAIQSKYFLKRKNKLIILNLGYLIRN